MHIELQTTSLKGLIIVLITSKTGNPRSWDQDVAEESYLQG